MEKENRQSKRILALMPEEEPVFIEAEGKQYAAKLVNISSGGALVSVLDCQLLAGRGSVCRVFFSDEDRLFGVKSKVLRKTGRYAAFRFVGVTRENSADIAAKIARMEEVTAILCPEIILKPQQARC